MNQENFVITQGKRELHWKYMCALYAEFKQKYDREPKQKEQYKGINLGAWVILQRQKAKSGVLSKSRREMLLSAGFNFNPLDKQWQEMFELYVEFKQMFHREPKQQEQYKDKNLGSWVTVQRQKAKKGVLSEERKDMLLSVGFVFDAKDDKWEKMYPLYVEFKEEFHREPKIDEIYKGENLGVWVSNQRRADKNDACSKIRKNQLGDKEPESLGLQYRLKRMIKLYLAFKEMYKREPKSNEVYQGVNLGRWLKDQKSRAKKGELSAKRQEQLIDAGVVLFDDAKENRWNEMCNLYIEYVQEFGRGPQANEKYKDVCLGLWVKTQRYRSETEKELLQQQYKAFLSKNGYSKDPLEVYWKKMYGFCLKFILNNNRMPKNKEEYWGEPLGNWFVYQNKLRKYNWLSEECINLLDQLEEIKSIEEGKEPPKFIEELEEEIPWGKTQEKWGKDCLLYVEYVQKNGCGPAPNEMYKKVNLGKWVKVQRYRLKTEKDFLQKQYQTLLVKKGYSEDPLELHWQEMYRLCCEFLEINNRTPQKGEMYLEKPLGNWLAYQVKAMRYDCLSEEQYHLLSLYMKKIKK